MQPFYQAFVTGDDTHLQGYFDIESRIQKKPSLPPNRTIAA